MSNDDHVMVWNRTRSDDECFAIDFLLKQELRHADRADIEPHLIKSLQRHLDEFYGTA